MAVDSHAMLHGGIAQLGERLNGIQEVRGSTPLISTMTNVLTAFSCQRTFVIFYLLNSDITGGVVHNYAFSCIHRYIGCR